MGGRSLGNFSTQGIHWKKPWLSNDFATSSSTDDTHIGKKKAFRFKIWFIQDSRWVSDMFTNLHTIFHWMVLDSLVILSWNGIFVYDHLSYLCIVLVDFNLSIANFHLTTWRSCQGCNSNSCGCVRQMRHLEFDGWGIMSNFPAFFWCGNYFCNKNFWEISTLFFQIFALYMPVWIHEPSCFKIFWNRFICNMFQVV